MLEFQHQVSSFSTYFKMKNLILPVLIRFKSQVLILSLVLGQFHISFTLL